MSKNTFQRQTLLQVAAVSVLLTGCDALHTRWQTVRLQVSELGSGKAIEDAALELAAKPYRHRAGREQEVLDRFGQHVSAGPDGIATIDLKVQFVLGGVFPGMIPGPFFLPDRVTGKLYLVRIRNDRAEETITVRMKRGDHADGAVYRLLILDIGKPRYYK